MAGVSVETGPAGSDCPIRGCEKGMCDNMFSGLQESWFARRDELCGAADFSAGRRISGLSEKSGPVLDHLRFGADFLRGGEICGPV
jgi:hypothetical protein